MHPTTTPAASKLLHCRAGEANGVSVYFSLASTGFLILFPGFLAYHYGISAGWWGPALGGLFGVSAALVAVSACIVTLLRSIRRRPLGFMHLTILGTLAYMIIWSLVNWIEISHSTLVDDIMAEATATVLIWIAMLYIGATLTTCPSTLWRLSAVGIAIVLFCFGHAIYIAGFPAGPLLAFSGNDETSQANYQSVGRSLLTIGLMAAFSRRPGSMISLLILLGISLLLLSLGSRAHFFVLCVLVLVHLAVLVAMRRTRRIGLTGMFVVVAVIAASASVFLETRAAEIIDLASSASWQGRQVAVARALAVIAEHPMTGLFGYHFWDPAGYAHNFLSVWTQYGLIGFVAFITTSACALYIALAGFFVSRGGETTWHLALHFNLCAILLAIFSEPVMSSVFPALAWGLTLRARRAHRAAFAASRS